MSRKTKKGQTLEQQCAMWQRLAAELERKCDRLEKKVLALASRGGMVRFDVHIAVRPKGSPAALERSIREALDGMNRDGAPAEILRRALKGGR